MQRKMMVVTAMLVLVTWIGAPQVAAQGPNAGAPRAPLGSSFTYQG